MNRRRRRMLESLNLDFEDHIQREMEDNIERGMPADEARSAALRKFGNVTLLKEQTRDVWSFIWLDQLVQDVRYALRVLPKNPGFTTVAVLTLALGIGMNTAVFGVVNAVLLQPLPYPDPDRLIWLSNNCPAINSDGECFVARSDYVIWRQQAHSFENMALIGNEDLALVYSGESTTERIGFLQGDFWAITGVRPALGHLFGHAERNTIVLTWAFFEKRFASNPAVLGKSVKIEGRPFTIIGVLPETFRHLFPHALYAGDEEQEIAAYIPTPIGHENPGSPIRPNPALGPSTWWFRVVAKLKPGVSFKQAHAEMQVIYDRIIKQYPNPYSHDHASLRFETVSERLVGHARPTLFILFGAVGFVLLIAIANMANLLLARASTREREIAIRAAIGAGRWRVIRQFLAESILLSLLGGIAGIALAWISLAAVVHFGSAAVPRLNEARVDGRVLFFALGLSFLTGVLFGLAPALTLARRNLDEVLKQDARTSSASAGQLRVRGLLVAGEVASAMVLLIAAGLMLKSFWQMSLYPPGVDPGRILTLRISLSGPQYDRQWPHQTVYLQQLFDRLQSLPGVKAFGIDCGRFTHPLKLPGLPQDPSHPLGGGVRYVSSGYLRAMGMPLLEGRWPKSDGEMLDVALVNEKLAHETGSVNILGRHIQGSFLGATVVGVVPDFKDFQLDAEPSPEVYTGYAMAPVIRSMRVVVRTSIDPKSLMPVLRKSISNIDKDVPVFQLQTLEQELSNSIAPRRFNLALLAAFAGTAVLLALVGIYGVLAYLVTQRTSEIGIRMTLGAKRRQILHLVLAQGMEMVLAGILLGSISSVVLTRLMASMLYSVKPGDPGTLAAVAILLASTALLACLVPAMRSALVDPLAALRHE